MGKLDAQYVEMFPLVSVAIPSYNAAGTLAETLDSVLGQTYPNVEVIVVDDGSTDNTQGVLARYAERVHVVRKSNGGLASARNAGFVAAQGKYIALLDADDLCMPERIAVQVAYMERSPDIVLCSSDFTAFNGGGVISDSYIANYYSRIAETTGGVAGIYPHQRELHFLDDVVKVYFGYVYGQMALGSFIHPPTVLFRKNILDKCGLLDEKIVNCCDFDWFVRMSRLGNFGFISRPLLKYRLSENQMSGSRNRLQIALDIIQVKENVLAADPALYNHKRQEFRWQLGEGYLNAADALVDEQSLAAIKMLIRSFRFGIFSRQSIKILIKAMIPPWFLRWWRENR